MGRQRFGHSRVREAGEKGDIDGIDRERPLSETSSDQSAEAARRIVDLFEASDHLMGTVDRPMMQRGLYELRSVVEVPVEAALGDTQTPRQGFNRHGLYAPVPKGCDRCIYPVRAAVMLGRHAGKFRAGALPGVPAYRATPARVPYAAYGTMIAMRISVRATVSMPRARGSWILVSTIMLTACIGGEATPSTGQAAPSTQAVPTSTAPTTTTEADVAHFGAELVKPAERSNRWEDARANDGSPFAFAWIPSRSNSDEWVVYLQGGGFCDDRVRMCRERSPSLSSTPPQADGSRFDPPWGGILSSEPTVNPTFHSANKVFAFYVSSDAWTGVDDERRQTEAAERGWYFSGAINVVTTFEVLIEHFGLEDSNPRTRVLLAGGSSGGVGAEVNAERIAALLPLTTARGDFRVLNDGGAIIAFDHPGFRPGGSAQGVAEVLDRAEQFWGAGLPTTCPRTPDSCLLERNLNRAVEALGISSLVQFCAVDSFATALHGLTNPVDPEQRSALMEFRDQARADLANVSWLFSGEVPSYHTTVTDDDLWHISPLGQPENSLARMVDEFWRNEPPRSLIFQQVGH